METEQDRRRKVGEAIRIRRRGLTLNSRGEFNRCSIPRLTLGVLEEEDRADQADNVEEVVGEDWTSQMLEKRDRVDKGDRDALGRAVKTDSCKRKEQEEAPQNRGRGRKRQKYKALDEDWGMVEVEDHQHFLYSALEGVKRPLQLDQT